MPKLADQVIARISSDESAGCSLCNFQFTLDGIDKFEESCNHLMKVHNLKCLHVGQETIHDDKGNPWQTTVAIFGV